MILDSRNIEGDRRKKERRRRKGRQKIRKDVKRSKKWQMASTKS